MSPWIPLATTGAAKTYCKNACMQCSTSPLFLNKKNLMSSRSSSWLPNRTLHWISWCKCPGWPSVRYDFDLKLRDPAVSCPNCSLRWSGVGSKYCPKDWLTLKLPRRSQCHSKKMGVRTPMALDFFVFRQSYRGSCREMWFTKTWIRTVSSSLHLWPVAIYSFGWSAV